tara:strand:+ start:1943 stop:2629 length:687 start_codon:yes stop_codon:yes gene_type:complete
MKNKYEGWELEYFDLASNFRDYQFQLIKNSIKGHVAEIGPGNGVIAQKYQFYAKKVELYETSNLLFKNLNKKFKSNKKIKIFNKTLKSKKTYNTIIYLDVIEHIKKDKSEIINALNHLKKNGTLIINVPAFSFLYSKFDKDVGHFRRYNKKDFKIILKDIKNISYTMKYYDSIGFMLSLLNKFFSGKKSKFMKSKILFWNSMILVSKVIDKITCNLFGKSLLLLIKKN